MQKHRSHSARPVQNLFFMRRHLTIKRKWKSALSPLSVSYSFGKTSTKSKGMNITVPMGNTSYAYQSNQIFTVRNGDTSYQVSVGTNDDGKPVASLYVYKGPPKTGKVLAEMKLAPHTVVNSISHALADDGIAESDSL